MCDAIADDLSLNVGALDGAIVHRYAPWDPEELTAGASERHLAVWPLPESAESADGLTTNAHLLSQGYAVLYWENAGDESSRQVLDEDAAAALLDLQEACRDRFYRQAATTLGGSYRLWYRSCTMPARSGQVRWFALELQSWATREFV